MAVAARVAQRRQVVHALAARTRHHAPRDVRRRPP
jgi:hypothetical protein